MPYEYTPASGIITAGESACGNAAAAENPDTSAVVTWDAATDTIHMDVTNAPIVGDLYASLVREASPACNGEGVKDWWCMIILGTWWQGGGC